jgi:hypothetical protein
MKPFTLNTSKPSTALARARVLQALTLCKDYWVDEETLAIQLGLGRPPISAKVMREMLTGLRAKAYADFRVDEISGLTEWRLTPTGRELGRKVRVS